MTSPALAETIKGMGRHYRHPAHNELVPSVTNVLSVINKPALMGWAAKQVATMAADLRESLGEMQHDEVVDLLKGAAARTSNRAGSRGTDVHEWIADELQGRVTYDLPSPAGEYLPAARSWLAEMKPSPVTVETTMFHPLYAGTADAVVMIGGERWLIDFKTSKGIYDEAALQVSALAGCFLWATDDGTLEAPPIERLAVVRFDDRGRFQMKEVTDRETHHQMFLALVSLWNWQHHTNKWKA